MLKVGDVVYCDPPYDGTFSGYHTDGFTEDDQYHLHPFLNIGHQKDIPVIVSNSNTSLTRPFIVISLTTTSGRNAASALQRGRENLQLR
ncbi:DNA adenine methylase [Escherichia coli]|uniref:DNA adenine methylase n=1 Tax=Escherichia coli TaxID=562 RepID=UPI003EB9193F